MEEEKKKSKHIIWIGVIIAIFIIGIIADPLLAKLENTTLSENEMSSNINQSVTVGKITYYVDSTWRSEKNVDGKNTFNYYYPSNDTMLMVTIFTGVEYVDSTMIDSFMDSYITGLNINEDDFISKSVKKINNYTCGVEKHYTYSNSNKYKTISYVIPNGSEVYAFSFGQKNELDDGNIDIIEKIIEKSIIISEEKSQETNEVVNQISNEVSNQTNNQVTNQISQKNTTKNEISNTTSVKTPTLGEKNALSKAKDYLAYTAFSYTGLIEQLEYEGFSKAEATYGADNCKADWNEQAAKKAKDYIDYTSFSKSGLIEQLEYEGFTKAQAEHGASAVGY